MFAAKLQAIAIVATVALTMTSAAQTATLRLSKHVVDSPPRSRLHALLTNGSSIPAGGSVWPTAIYWTTVQVGTPPKDFPVAIDSGSGDLDISGKGCSGCRRRHRTTSTIALKVVPLLPLFHTCFPTRTKHVI